MGRLDEHAKKRIVELRNAGLSFRKIKKVLELDNIRVTPQAVYLFLKRKNVDPEQPGVSAGPQQSRGNRNPWEEEQLWNLLNDSGSEQNKRNDAGTTSSTASGGQPGFGRQHSPDLQQGQSLGRQHGHEGQQCASRVQGSDIQHGLGRIHAAPEGPHNIGRQSGSEGQHCVGWQQVPEGQQCLVRKQGSEGQQGIGRQQVLDGQQNIVRQQGHEGQQVTGRQQILDGPQGIVCQQSPDGQQGIRRQNATDGAQGLVCQQCPDRQQGPRPPALHSGGAMTHELADSKDDIKIVSVTSLCDGNRQFGKASAPAGPCPGIQLQSTQTKKGDCPVTAASQQPVSASRPPPMVTVNPQQQLNVRGRIPLVQPRNPALIVKKKIVDRAIHFQKKVNIQNGQTVSSSAAVLPFLVGVSPSGQSTRINQSAPRLNCSVGTHAIDASTQTIPNGSACSLANQNYHWSGPPITQSAAGSSKAIVEKLEVLYAEVQKLTQSLHAMAERQNRMERQHEQQQQRFQQEVLGNLQHISSLCNQQHQQQQQQQQQQQHQQQQLCHTQSQLSQACLPYGNMAEATPALPSFGQFKMELL